MKSLEVKLPQIHYSVHPLIQKRWSARSFSEKVISEHDLYSLFEAASWASSSMNEQPWLFWYAQKNNPSAFKKFSDCLLPGNKTWAEKADVLVLNLASKNFEKNGALNRHYLHDCGAANTTLLLQAASLDIYGHMMGGFDMNKTIETFNIPDYLEPNCFIALGYLDEPTKLDEPFLTREITPRTRKPLTSFIKKID